MANAKDLESGLIATTARSVIPSVSSSGPVAAEANAHTPLELFQLLVGIHTPPGLLQEHAAGATPTTRTATSRDDNVGLYQRTKDQERASRLSYLATSIIGNTLYMLQIILAATITALSAYKQTTAMTLTALGAVSTVIAGSLAWQKGQGVPQRYRKARDQYAALLDEIEMTERAFVDVTNNGTMQLDPRAEKIRLQKLYDTARADQQANYPDLIVSTASFIGKDPKDLNKELEDVKAEAAKVQSDMLAKIETLMKELENKGVATINSAVASAVKV